MSYGFNEGLQQAYREYMMLSVRNKMILTTLRKNKRGKLIRYHDRKKRQGIDKLQYGDREHRQSRRKRTRKKDKDR